MKAMKHCRSLMSQFSRKSGMPTWAETLIPEVLLLRMCRDEILQNDPEFDSDLEEIFPLDKSDDPTGHEIGGRVGNRGLQRDKQDKIEAKKMKNKHAPGPNT